MVYQHRVDGTDDTHPPALTNSPASLMYLISSTILPTYPLEKAEKVHKPDT